MKITDLRVESLELPYKKPLITATNQFYSSNGFLVSVESDSGHTGYGYVDVFPRTGETVGSARYAIEEIVRPLLVGEPIEDLARLSALINYRMVDNRRAKGGVEIALYDLLGKQYGAPLYVLFGGLVRTEITVIKMVSVGSPLEMAQECLELVGRGYRALKLKVKGEVKLDLERVAAVRDAVGSDVYIKVDANEAFDLKSAIRMAAGMAELGVAVFEQPVPRNHHQILAEVRAQSGVKIEADQSAGSVHEAFRLIRDNACDSINTGILKAGGMQQTRQIADMCAISGTDCGLSNIAACMVGDAALLHLALSSPGISEFCEIGECEGLTGDPFTGIQVVDGKLGVPEGPGLGVTRS
jgi:L-alanine-DL-glutamate epimerase-like enolase superfamily enzyme